jgi:molybdopterin-containing oxidoreductase family membrane subunit
MKSQPGWYNALLAPLFICSALISGLAMVILAILFVRWAFQIEIEDDIIISLGKYFPILLPLLFYLLFCEFLTISYGGIPIHTAVLGELFGGRFSFIFWFNIIIGIIIPFLLAISPLAKRVKWVSLISILTLLGIFAERVDIILPSFYRPLLITSLVSYVPTWIELSIVAGVYAFGTAFLIIACKIIPIKEE